MKKSKKEALHQIRFLEFTHIMIAMVIAIICALFLFDFSHALVCYPVVFFLFSVMCACIALENILKSDEKKWLTIICTIVSVFFAIISVISGIKL